MDHPHTFRDGLLFGNEFWRIFNQVAEGGRSSSSTANGDGGGIPSSNDVVQSLASTSTTTNNNNHRLHDDAAGQSGHTRPPNPAPLSPPPSWPESSSSPSPAPYSGPYSGSRSGSGSGSAATDGFYYPHNMNQTASQSQSFFVKRWLDGPSRFWTLVPVDRPEDVDPDTPLYDSRGYSMGLAIDFVPLDDARVHQSAAPSPTTNQQSSSNHNVDPPPPPPIGYVCPLTFDVMMDPVIDTEGNTYERHAIRSWLAMGNTTSPITRNLLLSSHLVPNRALKISIDEWSKENNKMEQQQQQQQHQLHPRTPPPPPSNNNSNHINHHHHHDSGRDYIATPLRHLRRHRRRRPLGNALRTYLDLVNSQNQTSPLR